MNENQVKSGLNHSKIIRNLRKQVFSANKLANFSSYKPKGTLKKRKSHQKLSNFRKMLLKFPKKKQKKTNQITSLPLNFNFKEENCNSRRNYNKNYEDFTSIIEYLPKFEWFNSSAFQNKLLPIKFLSPTSFWFLICFIYFPRNFFNEDLQTILHEKFEKLNSIIFDPKLRISRTMKLANLHYDQEYIDSCEKINSLFKKRNKNMIEDSIQKNYEKNAVFKSNYTSDDDLFIIQVRDFILKSLVKLFEEKDFIDFNSKNISCELESEAKNLKIIKGISIDNILNLYNEELNKIQTQNNEIFDKMKENFEIERNNQKIFDFGNLDKSEMLQDLGILTREEEDYLSILENKQQLGEIHVTHRRINENFYETACQICNDGDYSEDNLIVFCSKCNISVHQKCYGIILIPHGDWICDLCTEIGILGKYMRCPLCQQRGGALKKTVLSNQTEIFINNNPEYHRYLLKCRNFQQKLNRINDNDDYYDFHLIKRNGFTTDQISEEPLSQMVWAHLTCVLWLPETYFMDRLTYSNIKGLENIDSKKFESICGICNKAYGGACVQCAKGKCNSNFHPECARRSNYFMEIKLTDKLYYLIFCEKHTPLKLKRVLENKEKKYKEEIIKFCRAIEKYFETYNGDNKIRSIPLSKTKKKFIDVLKLIKNENLKEIRSFYLELKDYISNLKNNKFKITLEKNINNLQTEEYNINEIIIKKDFNEYISQNDPIWKHFNFRNMNQEEIFTKYQEIFIAVKGKKSIKDELHYNKSKNNKINRTINTENKKEISETVKYLYCLCKKPYNEGEKMMACEKCEDWFHFKCIGFFGSDKDAENFSFICPKCKNVNTNTENKIDENNNLAEKKNSENKEKIKKNKQNNNAKINKIKLIKLMKQKKKIQKIRKEKKMKILIKKLKEKKKIEKQKNKKISKFTKKDKKNKKKISSKLKNEMKGLDIKENMILKSKTRSK